MCCICVLLAGCRQPDGPLPVENDEDPGRQVDVRRDLLNMAGGDPKARQEFADDLKVWGTKSSDAWAPGDELARRLAVALRGKTLTEPSAAQLARYLWLTTAGRQLSSRQVERLQEDIKGLLTSAGATEDHAQSVADQIGAVQDAVTVTRRWWFQVF
jgi:hypothetical protein